MTDDFDEWLAAVLVPALAASAAARDVIDRWDGSDTGALGNTLLVELDRRVRDREASFASGSPTHLLAQVAATLACRAAPPRQLLVALQQSEHLELSDLDRLQLELVAGGRPLPMAVAAVRAVHQRIEWQPGEPGPA